MLVITRSIVLFLCPKYSNIFSGRHWPSDSGYKRRHDISSSVSSRVVAMVQFNQHLSLISSPILPCKTRGLLTLVLERWLSSGVSLSEQHTADLIFVTALKPHAYQQDLSPSAVT